MNPVPELSWPHDLFSAWGTTRVARPSAKPEDYCACGCGVLHRCRVSLTRRSTYGRGFNIVYFASEPCKSRYVAKNAIA